MALDWFIVHTYSGYENRALEALKNRVQAFGMDDHFGEMIIPTENVVEIRDGKKRVSQKKFFPGYVLVQIALTDETWQVVTNTPRVTGFIGGTREKPQPLSQEEVDRILGQMTHTAEAPRPKFTFDIGEKVKIVEGPFASFQGAVEQVNEDRNTLTVMVTIFGRATPVELNFLQVEKT